MSGKAQEVIIIYDPEGNEVSRTVKDIDSTTGTSTSTGTGTGTGTGTSTVPSYTYTPGSAAPTDGSPMSYATWLQGDTKYKAETQRQKSIIDANNAYRTALASYGANEERKASMGLTNSGYSEYLTGKAYATQRADINAAESLAAQRKDAADYRYAQDLIEIGNQQNTNYGAIYDAVLNGATIESVTQDARWSTLSPDQQQLITQTANANVLQGMIDSGKSLDEVKADPRWATLTPDMQTKLESNYNESVELKSEANLAEFESNYASWLPNIKSGAITLDELRNLDAYKKMAADPNGATFITQLEKAQSDYNTAYNAKAKEELDITAGLTDDDIKQWADKYNIDEATVNEVKTDRNKAVNSTISTTIDNMMAITDPDEKDAAKDTILADIDEALEKGYISLIDVQGHYRRIVGDYINNLGQVSFEDAISAEKDYKALEQVNKITYKDYKNFTKAVYEKVGKVVPSNGVKREAIKETTTMGAVTSTVEKVPEGYDYTINGREYMTTINKNEKATNNEAKILTSIVGNKLSDGTSVLVGDTVYVYVSDGNTYGWYQLTKKPGMGAFVNAIS